jgi:NADPH:quinone reductase-like Zn-dependent oxidoreductase
MKRMKSVLLKSFGGSDQMYFEKLEIPKIKNNEVLIKVACTAINRAGKNMKYK